MALKVPGEQGWRGKDGVALCDLSCLGTITVEGSLPKSFANGGAGRETKNGRFFQLRPDRGIVLTDPGGVEIATKRLAKAKACVTDQTDGHSVIGLVGGAAPLLLRKLCGLDFDNSAFSDKTLKASSVAKTRQMIVRWDKGCHPCYLLIGPRSLADYVWETAAVAARDLNPATIGWEFYQALG